MSIQSILVAQDLVSCSCSASDLISTFGSTSNVSDQSSFSSSDFCPKSCSLKITSLRMNTLNVFSSSFDWMQQPTYHRFTTFLSSFCLWVRYVRVGYISKYLQLSYIDLLHSTLLHRCLESLDRWCASMISNISNSSYSFNLMLVSRFVIEEIDCTTSWEVINKSNKLCISFNHFCWHRATDITMY